MIKPVPILLAALLALALTACRPTATPTTAPTVAPQLSATPHTPTPSPQPIPRQVAVTLPVEWKPTLIAASHDALWVVGREAHHVARLDPKTSRWIGEPTVLAEPIYDILADEGGVWVTGDTTVTHLDPTTGKVVASLRADQFGDGTPFRLAVGEGLIWLLNLIEAPSGVHRIDPHTNHFVGEPVQVGIEAVGIAYGAGAVWTADHDATTVSRVDPQTNTVVATIELPSEPHYIYFNPDDGLIWVANYHAKYVTRIDPQTNARVGAPLSVPFAPEWMTSGAGRVWVLPSPTLEEHPQGVESMAEFDSTHPDEATIVPLGGAPMDAVLSAGSLWVTLQDPNQVVRLPVEGLNP